MVVGAPVTAKCDAAAAETTMVLVPAVTVEAVSVAVTVWLPAVFSVTVNVPVPPDSVLLDGSTAAASLLDRWVVPVYVVAMLLKASRAATVTVKLVPAVAVDDEVTE
jgi:hypothetical protein